MDKRDQWTVLTRGFVELMLSHPMAINLLAQMEWSCIPDETYYITLAGLLFGRRIDEFVEKKATTYVKWKWGIYPRVFESRNMRDWNDVLGAIQSGFWFVRKINDAGWRRRIDMWIRAEESKKLGLISLID